MRQAGRQVKQGVEGLIQRHDSHSSSDDEFFEQSGAAVNASHLEEGNQAGLGFDKESVSQNVLRAKVHSSYICLL